MPARVAEGLFRRIYRGCEVFTTRKVEESGQNGGGEEDAGNPHRTDMTTFGRRDADKGKRIYALLAALIYKSIKCTTVWCLLHRTGWLLLF
jgi:hypothetical protein